MISATLKGSTEKESFQWLGPVGPRTHDLRVTSPPLYYLSYQATDGNGAWMNPYDLTCAQEFPATDLRSM